jgi:hypothetical protein
VNDDGTKYVWFDIEGSGMSYRSTVLPISVVPDTDFFDIKWKPQSGHMPMPNRMYTITAYMDPREEPVYDPLFTSGRTVKCSLYLEGYTLDKWSGDSQRVRLNELLDDTSGYKLRVRLKDDNQGINQVWVTFHTNKGNFKESSSEYYTTYTWWVQDTAGIAEATLQCDDYSFPLDSFDYQITVDSDSSNDVTFSARCAYDEEISGLPYPYTHKKRTYPAGLEIRGDNFADYTMEELHLAQKNVKIEIDFDPNVISLSELEQVACSTWNILERGKLHPDSAIANSGIWGKIANISSADTVYCPLDMSMGDCKSALARSRDSVDHIHCVFGTNSGDSLLGIIVIDTLFRPHESNYGQRVFRFGHNSSGSNMRDSLNRAGVFLFVDHIKAKANQYYDDWKLVASWVFAHELGHALQMGHTHPDDFQTNIMHPNYDGNWDWETYNFFNIRSLEDAMSPPYAEYWRPALTTRDKLGVNTVGFNYYSRQGGKMTAFLTPLLTPLLLNPAGSGLAQKIPEILSQHEYFDMGISYRGHYEPYIARIEDDGNLGILYLTFESGVFAYNYVRYNPFGSMILDLRKFKTIKPFISNNLETLELEIPNCDYSIDESGNLWLIYVEGPRVTEKYIAWLKVDNNGKILEERHTNIIAHSAIKSIPSNQKYFHLFLPPFGWLANSYYRYYNPKLNESVRIGPLINQERVSIEPFPAFSVAPLTEDRLLVVSCDIYEPFRFRYFVINNNGKIEMRGEDIPIESCAHSKIENHGMVFNIDAFHKHDSVFVAVSISTPWLKNKVEAFYLVKFDSEGNLLRPEKGIEEGKLHSIEEMPVTVTPSVVLSRFRETHRLWYYGCDREGNLYLKKWTNTK